MANRFSILAWKILWMEEPGGPQFMGSQKSQTRLSCTACLPDGGVPPGPALAYSTITCLFFGGGVGGLHGLPRWHSGKESTCQCRRQRFPIPGGEDPLEGSMATRSSVLARRIPSEEPVGSQSGT